jgi:hypothetical protein
MLDPPTPNWPNSTPMMKLDAANSDHDGIRSAYQGEVFLSMSERRLEGLVSQSLPSVTRAVMSFVSFGEGLTSMNRSSLTPWEPT